jgi:hypothetical protein
MIEDADIVVLFCPPLSLYQEPPTDLSKCELVDCPSCENKMWLSEKKKLLKEFSIAMEKEIINECYICFAKRARSDPGIWGNHVRIDI